MPKKNGKFSSHPSAVKSREYKEQRQREAKGDIKIAATGRPRKIPARAVGIAVTVNFAGVLESVRHLAGREPQLETREDVTDVLEAVQGVEMQLTTLREQLGEAMNVLPPSDVPDEEEVAEAEPESGEEEDFDDSEVAEAKEQ